MSAKQFSWPAADFHEPAFRRPERGGVPHEHLLGEHLAGLLSWARSARQPVSLLLVALQSPADSHCAPAPFLPLEAVSAMQRLIGASDTLVRLGERDYAIMLAGASGTEARILSQVLRRSLVSLPATAPRVGFAVFPQDGADAPVLVRRALYQRDAG